MKKTSKIFASFVVTLVIIGLTLPLIKTFAQDNMQTPLQNVENKVGELAQLKDNSSLSDTEKQAQEIQIRKDALNQIVNLSLLETKNLENKLNSLDLQSDDQNAAKDGFLDILQKTNDYSSELKNNINKDGLALDEVKSFAQEYKDWRKNHYDNYIEEMTAFILVFQEKQVLKTANTRLDKIMSDLKKLENAKILKKIDTFNLTNQSLKSLTNAQILNSKAETLIVAVIKKDIIPMASSTLLTDLNTASTTVATSTENLIQSTGTTTLSLATTTQLLISATTTAKVISDSAKAHSFVEKSLQEIKNAYANFISISNFVNKKLKL